MKKSTRRISPMAEINVVPYIDVMLVLLVIFMITAPILTQGVTVDLPKMSSESVQTKAHEPVIVSVDKDGLYYLNTAAQPGSPLEPQALQVQVAAILTLAREEKQAINVLVKGDQGVNYGKVMAAMALLKQAGADKVGLITESYSSKVEGKA
jgi:biopolymer transport protein TolR